MHALEVSRLRLVSSLDQGLVCRLHQRRDAAAKDCLLAEEVRLGLFSKSGVQHAGAGAADTPGVCQPNVVGLAGGVLVNRDKPRHAGAPGEYLAHAVPRRLGGHHGDIHAFGRFDGLVVNAEAVGEHQSLARQQVWHDGLLVNLRLQVVGNQHHDDVRRLGRLRHGADFQTFGFGLGPALAALVQADHDIQPAVVKVKGVGVPLAAVADNTYRLVLD